MPIGTSMTSDEQSATRTRKGAGLQRVPVRNDVVVHEVEATQETVLFTPERAELMLLNEVGAGVWYLVNGRRSVHEIVALVAEHFPDQADRLADDITLFLEQLEHAGAIHFD